MSTTIDNNQSAETGYTDSSGTATGTGTGTTTDTQGTQTGYEDAVNNATTSEEYASTQTSTSSSTSATETQSYDYGDYGDSSTYTPEYPSDTDFDQLLAEAEQLDSSYDFTDEQQSLYDQVRQQILDAKNAKQIDESLKQAEQLADPDPELAPEDTLKAQEEEELARQKQEKEQKLAQRFDKSVLSDQMLSRVYKMAQARTKTLLTQAEQTKDKRAQTELKKFIQTRVNNRLKELARQETKQLQQKDSFQKQAELNAAQKLAKLLGLKGKDAKPATPFSKAAMKAAKEGQNQKLTPEEKQFYQQHARNAGHKAIAGDKEFSEKEIKKFEKTRPATVKDDKKQQALAKSRDQSPETEVERPQEDTVNPATLADVTKSIEALKKHGRLTDKQTRDLVKKTAQRMKAGAQAVCAQSDVELFDAVRGVHERDARDEDRQRSRAFLEGAWEMFQKKGAVAATKIFGMEKSRRLAKLTKAEGADQSTTAELPKVGDTKVIKNFNQRFNRVDHGFANDFAPDSPVVAQFIQHWGGRQRLNDSLDKGLPLAAHTLQTTDFDNRRA